VTGTTLPRFLLDLVVMLGVFAASALYVTRSVAIPWVVLGPSMKPTLAPGDRIVVDLWTYRRRPPRSGEIALLEGPGRAYLVKRVASGTASRPETRDGPGAPPAAADEMWFVVRGDNEAESTDSRQFGAVPRDFFRGRIVFRYWPLDRLGPIR